MRMPINADDKASIMRADRIIRNNAPIIVEESSADFADEKCAERMRT